MKYTLSIVAAAFLILSTGCGKKTAEFKKTKNALEYAIFEGDGGAKIAYGNVIQFRAVSYYGDSLLSTPFDTLIQIQAIDSMQLPQELVGIFTNAKVGDSIVTRMLVDSAAKFGPLPPYAKPGKFLGFRIKLTGVIKDSAVAEVEKMKLMVQMRAIDSTSKVQLVQKEDKILTDRMTKDGVQAVKTAKGTYVQIITPGTGISIDSGKSVTVDYKGMGLSGKIFDQSYNPSTGISEKPFTFTIGNMGAIEGWDDGLRLFKKGGKGRLYVPSRLGYGQRGSLPNIQPNEPLIFDIEVKNVMTPAEAAVDARKQQAEMMRMQQQQQQQMPQGGQ